MLPGDTSFVAVICCSTRSAAFRHIWRTILHLAPDSTSKVSSGTFEGSLRSMCPAPVQVIVQGKLQARPTLSLFF
jgi:hypothetical protein